ncbi:MAG: acyl carrier protein [Candidatus Omnitrophica bacterium]|jgi:acyl carrier protein|nr:acyl carrier protein [Candidatus Omnitrophota bacterium]
MTDAANEIFDKIKDCIAKALQISAGDIQVDSKLIADLGAESIDFLDIVFRLEKSFAIKIPRDDLFPEKVLTDPRYVKDGRITTEGLGVLKEKLPSVAFESFEKDPVVSKLPDLFTVRMIVDYINRRMATS